MNPKFKPFTAESGTFSSNTQTKKLLDRLAEEFSTNYCTASFSETEKAKVEMDELFMKPEKMEAVKEFERVKGRLPKIKDLQHRNILIVGSGATNDLYKCIPMGGGLKEALFKIKEIEIDGKKKKINIDQELIVKRNYLNRREFDLTAKPNGEVDFENALYLLSQWYLTPEELRKEIGKHADFKYPPSLLYEIIAHLFKHSFIDVVINFNFDELLDNAIEEELGKENYFHIVSDGDCIGLNEIMIDGRLKIPVYIKPHGTIKHKSSLKFTNYHYLDMPDDIKRLLESLVSGKVDEKENSNDNSDNIRVNLISVGFNMDSMEFNKILNEKLPKKSKIYHFRSHEREPDEPLFLPQKLPIFYENATGLSYKSALQNPDQHLDAHDQVYNRIVIPPTNNDPDRVTTPLCEMFSYLWRKIHYQFKEEFRPRSIGRHEIISYLFYDPDYCHKDTNELKAKNIHDLLHYKDNPEYFLDRTLVEIAMAINRNNGVVELAELLGDRVGKYYTLYWTTYKAKNPDKQPYSIYKLINEFKAHDQRIEDDEKLIPQNIFQLDTGVIGLLRANAGESIKEIRSNMELTADQGKLEKLYKPGDSKTFIFTLLKKFSQILTANFNPISSVVLYRLFTSNLLSESFINNFRKNYKKAIYNGKDYTIEEMNRMVTATNSDIFELKMIDELVRLFDKSDRAYISYFSIRPKFNDPQNFLFESFTKSKVLHTNLALEYKHKKLLLEAEDQWNLLLIVAEKGSLLGFLESVKNKGYDFSNKKIVIINAYEAVKQFHKTEINNIEDFEKKIEILNQLREKVYKDEIIRNTGKHEELLVKVTCLPALHHNHHMLVFIKESDKGDNLNLPAYVTEKNGKECHLNLKGAIYMFRNGFSNSVNPIVIENDGGNPKVANPQAVENDFKKLLRIFSKMYSRSLSFPKFPESEDLDFDTTRENLVEILNLSA